MGVNQRHNHCGSLERKPATTLRAHIAEASVSQRRFRRCAYRSTISCFQASSFTSDISGRSVCDVAQMCGIARPESTSGRSPPRLRSRCSSDHVLLAALDGRREHRSSGRRVILPITAAVGYRCASPSAWCGRCARCAVGIGRAATYENGAGNLTILLFLLQRRGGVFDSMM